MESTEKVESRESSVESTAGAGAPPGGVGGLPPVQPAPASGGGSTEEQRRKWREKRKRQQARKAGVPVAAPGASLAGAPSVASATTAQPLAPVPVPWTSDTLRPLFAELVPVVEEMDIDALKRLASKVSPEALARVSGRQWNPAAKSALVTSGAQVSAKWLNHFGISAENAPEIALALALASIGFGSMMLRRELRALAAEATQRRKDAEPRKETDARTAN